MDPIIKLFFVLFVKKLKGENKKEWYLYKTETFIEDMNITKVLDTISKNLKKFILR